MLSRIPLRHKMAKNKYQNFYQCKKVTGLLYNLESGKKGLKKVLGLLKFYKVMCPFGIPITLGIPCSRQGRIHRQLEQHRFCPPSWDRFHFL